MSDPLNAESFYDAHEKEAFVSRPECIRLMNEFLKHNTIEKPDTSVEEDNEQIKQQSFNNGLQEN